MQRVLTLGEPGQSLAQGTYQVHPSPRHPPSTQGAPPHIPGPKGWPLVSHKVHTRPHTHTHTLSHTHTLTALTTHRRASEAQVWVRNSLPAVLGICFSRENWAGGRGGHLLTHPSSHLVKRFGGTASRGVRAWMSQSLPSDFSQLQDTYFRAWRSPPLEQP